MLMRHLTFPFAHGHKLKPRKKYFARRSYNVSSLPSGCLDVSLLIKNHKQDA